jgi:hypothetical protein
VDKRPPLGFVRSSQTQSALGRSSRPPAADILNQAWNILSSTNDHLDTAVLVPTFNRDIVCDRFRFPPADNTEPLARKTEVMHEIISNSFGSARR